MTPTSLSSGCNNMGGYSAISSAVQPALSVMCTGAGTVPTPTPGASVAQSASICAGAIASPCPGGVCVPQASAICVYQAGTVPCSIIQGYSKQTVIYGGFADQSTCSSCQCTATGATCTPSATTYDMADCTGNAGVPGSLVPCLIGSFSSVKFDPGTPTGGSCAKTGGGVLTPNVVGSQAMTVCCM
jgi:hypothetical protein